MRALTDSLWFVGIYLIMYIPTHYVAFWYQDTFILGG